MTTGQTPLYGFVYPFGNEILSDADDLWQEFAYRVEEVVGGGGVAAMVSGLLTSNTPAGIPAVGNMLHTEPYDTFTDETTSTGRVPDYTLDDGFTIPMSGLWAVDASTTFLPGATPNTSGHVLQTEILTPATIASESLVAVGSPTGVFATVRVSTLRWFSGGEVVRGGAIVLGPPSSGELIIRQALRLSGPMNMGIPSGGVGLLRYPGYPVGTEG